jgi:hypothetical protein
VRWYSPEEARRQLGHHGGRDEEFQLLEDAEEFGERVPSPITVVERLQHNRIRHELWNGELQALNSQIASGVGDLADLHRMVTKIERDIRPFVGGGNRDTTLRDFREWREKPRKRIVTGIDVLDEHWKLGAMASDQTTIAGATSVGKTKFMNNLAYRYVGQGHRVAVFCWEVKPQRTLAQYVSMVTRGEIPYDVVCFQVDDPETNRRIDEIADQLTRQIRFFGFPSAEKYKTSKNSAGNRHMIDHCYGQVEDDGAEVAIFDLMRNGFPSSRPDDVHDGLQYARDWAPPFHSFYLHQLSMKLLSGQESDADLGDLLGGQAWVNVVENVFTLRRYTTVEEVMGEPGPTLDWMEAANKKQRWGPNGWKIVGRFHGESGTIDDWQLSDVLDSTTDIKQTRRRKSGRSRR